MHGYYCKPKPEMNVEQVMKNNIVRSQHILNTDGIMTPICQCVFIVRLPASPCRHTATIHRKQCSN